MDTLEPDTKAVLNKFINGAVFNKEKARLKLMLSGIQDQHSLRHRCRAFLLDGKPIWNGDAAAAKTKGKVPLDPDLQPAGRLIVGLMTKMSVDEQRLVNFLGTLSNRCHTFQDYRDVLPDMVVERMACPEIEGLSRTRKPGYVFTSPIKEKLYQDGVDTMLRYLVNDLLY